MTVGKDVAGNELDPSKSFREGGEAVCGIDFSHAMIHEGHSFTVDHFDLDLDTDQTMEVIVVAPSSGHEECHLMVDARVSSSCDLTYYEGPTYTGGTNITPVNRNRQNPHSPKTTVVHTPTIQSDGALLRTKLIGGTAVPARSGGDFQAIAEWVLKAGTAYLFRIKAIGDNTRVSLILNWYEM